MSRPPTSTHTGPGRDGAKPRRPMTPAGSGTVIGRGMTWRGDLIAAEDVLVVGTLEGTIESTGVVTIQPSGRIKGRVSAAEVRVAGRVEGNVTAARLIRVDRSGRVKGDLEARQVTMAHGAKVRGKILTQETWKGDRASHKRTG